MKKPQQKLPTNDDVLRKQLFKLLQERIDADPYGLDGKFAAQLHLLPRGLRAMAATHHLDVSLTLDDIGWHFLNFGQESHVRETVSGLAELGIPELGAILLEAYEIVLPLLPEIHVNDDYYECLQRTGQTQRIKELTDKAVGLLGPNGIYPFWIAYVRSHPENVFSS